MPASQPALVESCLAAQAGHTCLEVACLEVEAQVAQDRDAHQAAHHGGNGADVRVVAAGDLRAWCGRKGQESGLQSYRTAARWKKMVPMPVLSSPVTCGHGVGSAAR